MPKRAPSHLEPELQVFTIGLESLTWLGDLILAARTDLKPRCFAERHLVDELAIAKWRGRRVALMEKAVFEQQASTFRPRNPTDKNGRPLMPHEDIYHLARAYAQDPHSTESNGAVLAALGRLDTRYHRQFCITLRLLIALRRGTPPPVAGTRPAQQPITEATTNPIRKETTTCEPSPSTPQTM